MIADCSCVLHLTSVYVIQSVESIDHVAILATDYHWSLLLCQSIRLHGHEAVWIRHEEEQSADDVKSCTSW